jgi:hypothetical protein
MASMSILDDAIREHLELKRAHGADESEIKRLEDEAFGPPGRPEEPDAFAEAPTEFMSAPDAPEATEAPEGRRINVADLQEAPPAPDQAEPVLPAEDAIQAAAPAEEEPPPAEHEPKAEASDAGHTTDEREAIADQPTEFFDVAAEIGSEEAPAPPASEAPSPSDEELAEAEAAEPKLTPVEPATEIHAIRTEATGEDEAEEEDDEFWSDQRLSDELDQALEAPPLAEQEDEPPLAEAPPTAEEPISEEHEQPEAGAEPEQRTNYDPETGHEDVLEDTPDFLENAPEDDELWFEQRPPKDFDFDD